MMFFSSYPEHYMSNLVPISVGFDHTLLAGSVAPSSLEMYARDFKAYLAYAVTPEMAVESSTLARWRTHLARETRLSPNTINRMISAVKRLPSSTTLTASRPQPFSGYAGSRLVH